MTGTPNFHSRMMNVQIGNVDFVGDHLRVYKFGYRDARHAAAAIALEADAEIDRLRAECLEQARLNGMGAEREAGLLGQIAQMERDALRLAARLRSAEEALVWCANAPMIATMRALGASDDELSAEIINHLERCPAHYEATLARASGETDGGAP